jgi:hypothetical protein
VVTRLTLRTRDLPSQFGAVNGTIAAASEAAFGRLIGRAISFFRDNLVDPHWGEQVRFGADNTLALSMVFQGFDQAQVHPICQPLFDWAADSPDDFTVTSPLLVRVVPARDWWNGAYLAERVPGRAVLDLRPGAPANNAWFAGQKDELGVFLHGYDSAWLPALLLEPDRQDALADALFAATRFKDVTLHFNKGLAGASDADRAAARDTAMHPAVLDAFALAIVADAGPQAYAGMPGAEPDLGLARRDAHAIGSAMQPLWELVPDGGSYVSESNFFNRRWQEAFWGPNYPRLRAVKDAYDPEGLFFVHHGVGSDDWSADGFTRLS